MPGFEGLLAGRTLCDRYRVEEVIGRGGFAAVYRATDERLGRTVAVKVTTFSASNPQTRDEVQKRFRREARAAASLHHPNVVTVYDFGTDPVLGLEFFVMELLQGEDLAHRLARAAPIPLRVALRILRDAALGVDAGHRAGMVHRDIKPGNIFLARRDRPGRYRVCVLDFGIARPALPDEATQLTRVGGMLLSPAYASPEQLRGELRVSPASDVFSLGVIGYELLCRERPFPGYRLQIPHGEQPDPVPLRERCPEVPPGIAEAIHRALAEDPEARFPTAGAFAEALAAADPLPDAPAAAPHADTDSGAEPEAGPVERPVERVVVAAAAVPAADGPPAPRPVRASEPVRAAEPAAPARRLPPPDDSPTVRYSPEALAEQAPPPRRDRDRRTRRRAALLGVLLVGAAGAGWLALAGEGGGSEQPSAVRRTAARQEPPAPGDRVRSDTANSVWAAPADSARPGSAAGPGAQAGAPAPAGSTQPARTAAPAPAQRAPAQRAPATTTPSPSTPRVAVRPTSTTARAPGRDAPASRPAPAASAPAERVPARTPARTAAAPAGPRLSAPERLNREGEALFERNNVAGAVERFRAAVRAAPNNAYYRNNLGWALFQLGETDAAGRELEETLRLNPRREIAYANLGEVRAAQGDTAAAIAMYERFVELNTNPRREQIAMGKLRRLRGIPPGGTR
ncbi:MAG TPA: protein kinase [Longimicrobiaceae bacterium]|jgi:serine/threonine-protein kinase